VPLALKIITCFAPTVVLVTLLLEFPSFDGFPFVIVLDDVPDWSGQKLLRVIAKVFFLPQTL
jgi:hypothetical protein